MALKLGFVVLAALLILQFLTWESQAIAVKRETTSDQKNASQTIDEAIQSFKSGLDDLVKKIQSNEVFQNVSHSLQEFGKSVQDQGKQLVQRIQGDGQSTPGQ